MPVFEDAERRSTHTTGWLATVAVAILAALPRLTSLHEYLVHDETQYWEWSRQFFFALLKGDWSGTIVGPGNPSITLFWNSSFIMGLKYAWAQLTGVGAVALSTWPDFHEHATFDLLVERRVPIVLFNTLAVVIAYRLMRRLFGGRVAVVASVLLALDPFYLADSRTSRGEGLLASLVVLAILCYLNYLACGRWRYLVFSGLLTGLALLTKTPAVAVVIWAAIVSPLHYRFREAHGDWLKRAMLSLLLWGAIIIATYWALWPAMWVAPGKVMTFLSSFVSDVGVEGRDNYFFGQVYHAEPLPLYYPVVFVLRATPLGWLGLVAASVYLVRSRLNSGEVAPAAPNAQRRWFTTCLLGFVLIYAALMSLGTLKRDWYILPTFPALDITAAVGLVALSGWVWTRFGKPRLEVTWRRQWWAGASLAVILGLQVLTIYPSHPYYYAYWNPLVLGNRWASFAVMIGWDLDLSAGANYLNGKPDAEHLQVAIRNTHGFEQQFVGHAVRWVNGEPWIQADYLLVRANHLQLNKIGAEFLEYAAHLKLEHVVTLGGVDYLWIYQGPRAEYYAGYAELTGKAILLGYDLGARPVTAGQALPIKLYWQNTGMADADDLFVRLVDASGYVWADGSTTPLQGFEDNSRVANRIVESQVNLQVPVGTPPGDYSLQVGVYDRTRVGVLGLFHLPANGSTIVVQKPTTPPSAAELQGLRLQLRLDRVMTPDLMLLGFHLVNDTLWTGDTNWLTLYWSATKDVSTDYAMGIQLLTMQGKEVAYWLGRPVMSAYPTTEWRAGEIVRDPWRLELPGRIAPGDYLLQLTLYDGVTGNTVDRVTLTPVLVSLRGR